MTHAYLRPSLLPLQPYDAVPAYQADKLDANEFPLDMPEWFKTKLALVWEKAISSNRYPEASHHGLKEAIAAYAGVNADQVSLGNGSDELIRSVLIATCLENRGPILVAEPTFSMYAIIAQSLGIPVIRTRRQENTMAMDVQLCQQALEEEGARVVCVTSPNSPTGNALTAEEWNWLEGIPDRVLVLIDEAYFEFCGQTAVPRLPEHPNWVVLRTFSKAFRLAAHRVGYAIGDPGLIRVLEAIRLPYNLPSFSQWAAQLALEHRGELLADVELIRQERARLYPLLQAMPGLRVWPSQANFFYLRHASWDLGALQRAWLAAGTCVRLTGGGLRLTVGTRAENERALQRLAGILA
ncbi:MAG: histidinol-phosphate transaminase [Thermostichales cyanobacterium SRBZ-1_bins_19]